METGKDYFVTQRQLVTYPNVESWTYFDTVITSTQNDFTVITL